MEINFFYLIIVLFGIALSIIFLRNLRFWQRSTGGKLNEFLNRWEVYAPQAYAKIREENDLESIANNTGLSIRKIQRIKTHIFFEKHQLDDGIRLFDPDPDIADAWFRLQQGNYNDEDLRLLKHEYFEARFEGIFKTDYRTAHSKTIQSGRTWNPS